MNVGDGYSQGSQNRSPSPEFTRLAMPSTSVTSRTDVDVPKNSTPDHTEQHNQSSTFILPISIGLPENDLKPQGPIRTMGVGMLTSRILVMGHFQGKNLDRIPRIRTLVMQPTTLLVGVIYLLTFGHSEFFVYKAQIHETRMNPRTSPTRMSAKYSQRTKRSRYIRHI